jgi:hypothetical protein
MGVRLTKTQRQKLKQLMIIADMHRYTDSEAIQFIRESLGWEVSRQTLYNIRREQRKDAISWLSKMRSGKYGYIIEFKKQVEEFELYKEIWFKLYDSTKSEFIKLKCIEKMAHMTIALVNMYNLLPQIAQNVPIDVINNNNKIDYYKDDKDLSVY